MLDKDIFKEKYDTTYKQIHEESFLETVDKEDRDMFEDAEILTGRNSNTKVNKFNTFGKKNKGKKYNTIKQRCITSFSKYIDNKLSEGKEDEIWDRIWNSTAKGNYQFAKLLTDRMMGKEEENINLDVSGDINFIVDDSTILRKKEDE